MARGSFRLDVADFAKQAGENADLAVRKIMLDLHARLIEKSPVDTGRFRANWQYSVNAKATGTIDGNWTSERRAPPPKPPKIAAGAFGKVHYMTNNVEYANALEFGLYPISPKKKTGKTVGGYSRQAPQGIVGLTIIEFDSIVKAAASEVRNGAKN